MIELVGLLLAILGIVFAFETPRQKFVNFFGGRAKTPHSHQTPTPQTVAHGPAAATSGATQSGRSPFFISEPLLSLQEARDESRKTGKPLFLVIYDDEHPSKSKLDYSLGCFLDYFATKKLLEQHFVCALLPVSARDAREYVPDDDPLENALLVVTSAAGEVLRREGVYANPDEGLKRVRAVIAQLADASQETPPK